MIGKTEIKSIDRLLDLDIVIEPGRKAQMLSARQPIVNGEHRTYVVDHAGLGIIDQPMKFGGKEVSETAVGHLVGNLKTVAPVHLGIDAVVTHTFIAKRRHQTAPIRELEPPPSLGISDIKAQTGSVFKEVAVVVTANGTAREAHMHAVVKEGILYRHRVEPPVELGAVMVEAKLLLHLDSELTHQVGIIFCAENGAKVAHPPALSERRPCRKQQENG